MSGQAAHLRFYTLRRLIGPLVKSGLFRKYVVLIGIAFGALLMSSSLVETWFTAREHREALQSIQREQADAAATRMALFFREIEGQLGWMTQLSWNVDAPQQRELDAMRLLRQVPAISQLRLLDGQGRERLRMSRQAMDLVETMLDASEDPAFKGALVDKVHYGPVSFRRGTEPVMSIAMAGARRDAGVVIAEVNLTHIWDVIHSFKVGQTGRAYVVEPSGRLLAHPDLSLVLRNTDLSVFAQFRAALSAQGRRSTAMTAENVEGQRVLTTSAVVDPLKWMVFVELPEREANAPLYASMTRSALLTLLGGAIALGAALILAHRMVVPIRTLSAGAARIGSGFLTHRIKIDTGDELQALGDQFNDMAQRMQTSYATLERKVDERTQELQAANLSKSRFLAAASHDLRQPLHALNLLVAQMRNEAEPKARAELGDKVEAAIANMNELFGALLDISKLDAQALMPAISAFPVKRILAHIASAFGPPAREKGLHFSVVPSDTWVLSDRILLERILLNLASNAVRYTSEGGVVIGCRRRGAHLRIDVYDTGIGIPTDQQQKIFAEFYRGVTRSPKGEGLGLGLAIVDRLSTMLNHPIEVVSTPGSGSRFSLLVPIAEAAHEATPTATQQDAKLPASDNQVIAVVDDDDLVLRSTSALLQKWGYKVIEAESLGAVMARARGPAPSLILSDYRLRDATGIDVVLALRARYNTEIPGLIITGDVSPTLYEDVKLHGLQLLHKPLPPMALRASIEQQLLSSPTG